MKSFGYLFLYALVAVGIVLSCDGEGLLKDEESKSSSKKGSTTSGVDVADISDPNCTEGETKMSGCANCMCSGGVWNCDDVECSEPTDIDDCNDGGCEGTDLGDTDAVTCDALGYTWRFKDGQCYLDYWSGCGPSGTHFNNLKNCVEENDIVGELQWLPAKDGCPEFADENSNDLVEVKDCGEIKEGDACIGNNGPGCSGDDCSTMGPTMCKSDTNTLACRQVDFKCEE